MYSTTTTTALLSALIGSALSSPINLLNRRSDSTPFKFHPTANPNLSGWAIRQAHIAAGTNVLEIQRPSAFTSDTAYLSGTEEQTASGTGKVLFELQTSDGTHFGLVIPSSPRGSVVQVTTQPGAGSAIFSLDTEGVLNVLGNGVAGFWACPTMVPGDGEVFTLYYGVDVPLGNLPSVECQPLRLGTEQV